VFLWTLSLFLKRVAENAADKVAGTDDKKPCDEKLPPAG
jgi:hypothetical protein